MPVPLIPMAIGGLAGAAMTPTAIALAKHQNSRPLASNTDLDHYSNLIGDVDGYDISQIMKQFIGRDPLTNLNGLVKHTTPDMYVETVEDPTLQATVTNNDVLGDVAHAVYTEENSSPLAVTQKTTTKAKKKNDGTPTTETKPKPPQNGLDPLSALVGLAALYGGYRLMR